MRFLEVPLLLSLWTRKGSGASLISSKPDDQIYELGANFVLEWSNAQFVINRRLKNIVSSQTIWSSIHGEIFISASAGNDSVLDSNGNFDITQVDVDRCQAQTVTAVHPVAWNESLTGTAVTINGQLLSCGAATAPYTLTFWVPLNFTDRVAFFLDIASTRDTAQPLKKLYFSYQSFANEDFYGLGAQASFASLKGQSIPIFSREQGVGRSDQPITDIENANGSFAGGTQFTTYTAIPQYITTESRVSYLSEKSTGYANFDLTQSDAVVVRYDSLAVDGQVMRADDMFGAVEMLTAYTGRMPALPDWVDTGAILGIQGGQAKVNRIVEQGLGLNCPIAAVWLQDWCGTHQQAGPYLNVSRLWWNWENDEELYPTWDDFVQSLRSDYNVRTLSYVNVFLANVSTKPDGFRRNLYDEATASRYFVQNKTTDSTAIISSGPGRRYH